MSTLEYLNLHAISSLLLRASHPQVCNHFHLSFMLIDSSVDNTSHSKVTTCKRFFCIGCVSWCLGTLHSFTVVAQVVKAFDGRGVCRLVQSMASLAILKGDASPDQVWIPFSEEEAGQMWASIRARCGVNITSSWQSRWRTVDDEEMQVSNKQKRKLKDDPTRRPFYSVPVRTQKSTSQRQLHPAHA